MLYASRVRTGNTPQLSIQTHVPGASQIHTEGRPGHKERECGQTGWWELQRAPAMPCPGCGLAGVRAADLLSETLPMQLSSSQRCIQALELALTSH